jgi:hypothetical protein
MTRNPAVDAAPNQHPLPSEGSARRPGPLAGPRVVEPGKVCAAPITAMMLGRPAHRHDQGRASMKRPGPFPGLTKDGHGVRWKVIARNRRTITLNFGNPDGSVILLRLVAQADVLIENFRLGRCSAPRRGHVPLSPHSHDQFFGHLGGGDVHRHLAVPQARLGKGARHVH